MECNAYCIEILLWTLLEMSILMIEIKLKKMFNVEFLKTIY